MASHAACHLSSRDRRQPEGGPGGRVDSDDLPATAAIGQLDLVRPDEPASDKVDEVPAEDQDKVRAEFAEKAKAEGKPADMVDKIVEGQVKKHFAERCLLDQPFVKDPDQTVEKLLKAKGGAVAGFARLAVGEGIEKKQTDFAAEVAAASKV